MSDNQLRYTIQNQVDKALRGTLSFKSFTPSYKKDEVSNPEVFNGILMYDLTQDQFVQLIRADINNKNPMKSHHLQDLDQVSPNFTKYAYWLQEELYRIIIDCREKHQLLLIDEKALIQHILAYITITLHHTCLETCYIKASNQSHEDSLARKREQVIDKMLNRKGYPQEIANKLCEYFQPEEEKNITKHADCILPLEDSQKKWLEKKLLTGIKNQKKPLINFFHALMQPLSLALVVSATYFSAVWNIALANYIACIAFFTPNPLKPLQYRLLNQQHQIDRRIILAAVFISFFIGGWALLNFTPGLSTLLSIKIVTAVGIGSIAINKIYETTKNIRDKNIPIWQKMGILIAEYLINILAIVCISMTFIGPQYTIFSEILLAWYSVDLCIGTLNLIPNFTDNYYAKTLWTALTFTTGAYIAALATGYITLIELYIACTATFACITRIASTHNIEPVIMHTCARHSSYLWLCWLTIENRLKMAPTKLSLILCLAVEVISSIYDCWKNRRYGLILDKKVHHLRQVSNTNNEAEKSYALYLDGIDYNLLKRTNGATISVTDEEIDENYPYQKSDDGSMTSIDLESDDEVYPFGIGTPST